MTVGTTLADEMLLWKLVGPTTHASAGPLREALTQVGRDDRICRYQKLLSTTDDTDQRTGDELLDASGVPPNRSAD